MKCGSDNGRTTCAPRLSNVVPYMLQYWHEPPFVSFSIVLRTFVRSVAATPNCSELPRAIVELELAVERETGHLIGHVGARQADVVQSEVRVAELAVLAAPLHSRGRPRA